MAGSRTGTLIAVVAFLFGVALSVGVVDAIARSNPITNPPEVPDDAPPATGPTAAQEGPSVPEFEVSSFADEVAAPRMIALSGDRLLVGDKSSELHAYSWSSDGVAEHLAEVRVFGEPVDAAFTDELAFVASSWGGLNIVDVSDPTSPTLVAVQPAQALASGVAVSEEVAYVADWNAGLQVVDVADPSAPVVVSTIRTDGHVYDVAMSEDVLFAADFEGGLLLFDITDPTDPVEIGSFDTPAAADIALSGSHAFLADEQEGLYSLDIRDPAAPMELARFATLGPASSVAISDDMLVVSDLWGGMYVLDVSDPGSPELVCQGLGDSTLRGVATDGERVLFVDDEVRLARCPRGGE